MGAQAIIQQDDNADKTIVSNMEKSPELSKKVIVLFNQIIAQASSEVAEPIKNAFAETIAAYLKGQLAETKTELRNETEVAKFLTDHYKLITPVISICKEARQKIGEPAELLLSLDDYGEGDRPYLSLYVKHTEYSTELTKLITSFSDLFDDIFADEKVYFVSQPIYSKK